MSLAYDLHLERLSRPLRSVAALRDPHARRAALHRAGLADVAPQDQHRAADIVRSQRRALMRIDRPAGAAPAIPARPAPSTDHLVELMAQALVRAVRAHELGSDLDDEAAAERALVHADFAPLDAGRLVRQAVARARAKIRRGTLLDHAADGAAFGSLVLAWTAGSCLLCPPARAAGIGAVLTDEGLSRLWTWAPIMVAIGLIAAFCWRDRGRPWTADEEELGVEPGVERRVRDADRG